MKSIAGGSDHIGIASPLILGKMPNTHRAATTSDLRLCRVNIEPLAVPWQTPGRGICLPADGAASLHFLARSMRRGKQIQCVVNQVIGLTIYFALSSCQASYVTVICGATQHPGTPCIFYDHFVDGILGEVIQKLINIRRRIGLHTRSKVGCADLRPASGLDDGKVSI